MRGGGASAERVLEGCVGRERVLKGCACGGKRVLQGCVWGVTSVGRGGGGGESGYTSGF
jgi:hypothetical protein